MGTAPLPLRCLKRTEYTVSMAMDWTCWPEHFECLPWPAHSSYLTPCDVFLWSFVKRQVYRPPLPPTIDDLRVCITEAIALVEGPMQQCVWQEIEYRIISMIEHL